MGHLLWKWFAVHEVQGFHYLNQRQTASTSAFVLPADKKKNNEKKGFSKNWLLSLRVQQRRTWSAWGTLWCLPWDTDRQTGRPDWVQWQDRKANHSLDWWLVVIPSLTSVSSYSTHLDIRHLLVSLCQPNENYPRLYTGNLHPNIHKPPSISEHHASFKKSRRCTATYDGSFTELF